MSAFISTLKKLKQRGGAMVEFSIMMIVLVPLLTYGFYIIDLGHHLLDVQETVISTTWDYTSRSNEADPDKTSDASNGLDAVFHANRFEFADHTTAYDDFSSSDTSSVDAKSHFEMGSKAAWVGGGDQGLGTVAIGSYPSDYASQGARQVTCAINRTDDLKWLGTVGDVNPAYAYGHSKYTKGGVVTCWAKLRVYNYIVPEKFMQERAAVDVTDSKFQARSTNVEGLSNAAKPLILRDHAALSFGTWAINNGGDSINDSRQAKGGDIDYCPAASNPFYARVAWMESGGGTLALTANAVGLTYKATTAAAEVMTAQALSNELEIIVAVPIFPGNTDASPEGIGGHILAIAQAELGRPANPIGAFLVARHDRSNMQTGVLQSSATSWGDAAAYFAGPKYESTPFKNGNTDYQTAYNKRGQFYMGQDTDNG